MKWPAEEITDISVCPEDFSTESSKPATLYTVIEPLLVAATADWPVTAPLLFRSLRFALVLMMKVIRKYSIWHNNISVYNKIY
jgi:hypothetical protein